ncbi:MULTISPECIES: transcriptional regulator [Serratia]|uniref:transcriptional regulator n=1 Tax=Serratia TaxID=613 RepID=UPI0007601D40|nr:transcriptional regulator [Serratia marcescens]
MTSLLKFKQEKKLTLKELCVLLGETAAYEKALGDVVNGKRQVPAAKVMRWAEKTGIHPHKLRPDIYKASHFPNKFKSRVKVSPTAQ